VIDELLSGLRVRSRSWVGVIRFSTFELRVVPKLVGGDPGLVRMIDYTSGLDSLKRYPAFQTFKPSGSSLLDLLSLLFAEAGERVARAGLKADYQEIEDDLPVVRGRMLVRKQVLQRFGRIDRLECRFDEHTTDTTDNQILLVALTACTNLVRHPAVAVRIRRLLAVFSEACSMEGLDLRTARALMTYDRLNEHYREAHGLAWVILDGLGIDDLFTGGSHGCFAFLFDMNRLFEDFITRWLDGLLAGGLYRVLPQRRDRTILWNADLNRPYTQVIPDILIEQKVEHQSRFLPVDAKYKLYDQKNISPGDIYQSFLYAFAYGREHEATLPAALLLYPASSAAGETVRLHVRRTSGSAGAEVQGLGVHLPTALAEAEARATGSIGVAIMSRIQAAFEHPGKLQDNRLLPAR
jgi:5-methylcytosine-specific restriction enzyme subunit McrC